MAFTKQPTAGQMLIGSVDGHREWSTGVLDCFSDFKSCKFVYFCGSRTPFIGGNGGFSTIIAYAM